MPTFNGPDWFSPRIPLFEKHLAEFVGKPDLLFLEIGSFEGRSALWMLSNVLTGPYSRLLCVDTWKPHDELPGVDMEGVFSRFIDNVIEVQSELVWQDGGIRETRPRVEYRCGPLLQFLMDECADESSRLNHGLLSTETPFDFVYIDGSHHAADVFTDSAMAWQLLKVGGIMAWDDIGWRRDGSDWDHPVTAVSAFMSCFRDRVQVLSEPGDQQVWVRKVRP